MHSRKEELVKVTYAPTIDAPPPLPWLELRWTVEATMLTVAPL